MLQEKSGHDSFMPSACPEGAVQGSGIPMVLESLRHARPPQALHLA